MDIQEVRSIAKYYGFRIQNDGEKEKAYRHALSRFLHEKERIVEAHEVVSGRYEISDETMNTLTGAATNALDGRLPQVPEVDRAVVDMIAQREKAEGLAELIIKALALGVDPADLS